MRVAHCRCRHSVPTPEREPRYCATSDRFMDAITYTPIGIVHSPFTTLEGMPLHTIAALGIRGVVELEPAFREGLAGLEGFSHLLLLTHLHRMTGYALEITPYLDDQPHGIFATRSPRRPNPLGLSLV